MRSTTKAAPFRRRSTASPEAASYGVETPKPAKNGRDRVGRVDQAKEDGLGREARTCGPKAEPHCRARAT
jgi:hypothetical protein